MARLITIEIAALSRTEQDQNQHVIAEMEDVIELLPPITISRDGQIIDGHHRVAAAIASGLRSIEAIQIDADYDELTGFDAMQIAWAAAEAVGASEASDALTTQFDESICNESLIDLV